MIKHVIGQGVYMLKMFSRTVAIVIIVCSTTLFAQSASQTNETKPIRTTKSLQSMNFYLPIESETWKIKAINNEWSSVSYQFGWTRYKTEANGYSSIFGLGIGFLNGSLKDEIYHKKNDLKGLDFNVKLGIGMAPISNKLIAAVHFLCGLDLKIIEGEIKTETHKYTTGAIYVDAVIGGTVIVGYHVFDTIGVIGGFDITTNAYGIGAYYNDPDQPSKTNKLSYLFTGVNFTPHIGLFFVF